ncbi:MAG: WYL domain-containing protein [Sporichthyaceae bacterium]
MSPVAVYATRLAALPRALGILELHPQGLPLSELATELGLAADDLREVFMAYYLADLVELGSLALPVVEFFAPGDGAGGRPGEGDDDVPAHAQWVRVIGADPEHELGVDHLTATQLAALHAAGVDLLALEPGNLALRDAVEAFEAALAPVDAPEAAQWGADTAQALHRAAEEHRQVRITYSRQWHPGTRERVIEPYRLVRTRRGWEVDAGPPDDLAAVRTYLVSGIVGHEVTDRPFEPPADLDTLLAANRAARAVQLVVPQTARWAVERYAESTHVTDDDEGDVALTADLLPPVDDRLGLLLLCCGPSAFVVQPAELSAAGARTAQRLLDHHSA